MLIFFSAWPHSMQTSTPQSIEVDLQLDDADVNEVVSWPETSSKWIIILGVASFWLMLLIMSVPCLYYAIKERNMTLAHPGHPGTELAQKTVVISWVIVTMQVVILILLISGQLEFLL